MTESFIEDGCHCAGQIEGPGVRQHGQTVTLFSVLFEDRLRQAHGFTTENKKKLSVIISLMVKLFPFFRKEKKSPHGEGINKGREVVVAVDLQLLPVIHTGTAQETVFQGKTQGFDQVKGTAQSRTGAANITRILRNFWFQ